ncbi:unnamed protein product, partial [marine sediment metagenome]
MKQNKGKFVVCFLIIVILLVLLFPFFVTLSTAFKPLKEVYASPPHWIPYRLWWRNFSDVWTNTLWRSILSIALLLPQG